FRGMHSRRGTHVPLSRLALRRIGRLPEHPVPRRPESGEARAVAPAHRPDSGALWDGVGEARPSGDHTMPAVPEVERDDWAFRLGPPTFFRAGFRREVENYLDMTHFAFAHATTLGKCADPRIPDMEITTHPDGFQMDAPFPALETPHEQPGKLQSAHHRRQRCHLPNFTTIRQTFQIGRAAWRDTQH